MHGLALEHPADLVQLIPMLCALEQSTMLRTPVLSPLLTSSYILCPYSQEIKLIVGVVQGVITRSHFILPNCPERVPHVVSISHFSTNGVSSVLRKVARRIVIEEIPFFVVSLDHHYTVRPAPIATKSSFWWPQSCLSSVSLGVINTGVSGRDIRYIRYDQCEIPVALNHSLQHIKWISWLWLVVVAPGHVLHLRMCLAPLGHVFIESHRGRLHENSNTQL